MKDILKSGNGQFPFSQRAEKHTHLGTDAKLASQGSAAAVRVRVFCVVSADPASQKHDPNGGEAFPAGVEMTLA